ncbi:MAG: MBL fold metallo-hydrolase [Pseudomonadota bacterium]
MPSAAAEKLATHFEYPFPDPPTAGQTVEVAPGVHWLRQALPFALEHINVWCLEDAAGPVLVDTGIRGEPTQRNWLAVLDGLGLPAPSRLLVTHMHPDHAGSAGWLCEHFGIRLAMTRTEYLMCRVLASDFAPPPAAAVEFFHAAGFSDDDIARYKKLFGGFGKAVDELPASFDRLIDGQIVNVGAADWEVVVGRGHSPEHACLFNAGANVVIAGDQILPTISSNVSVWPTEPAANPLKEWLDSCRALMTRLPEDVLVLPSHGKPFVGAHRRLQALIDEHEQGLARLLEHCREPRRAVDVFPALFRSDPGSANLTLATGESIAHLNYLQAEGLVRNGIDDDGRRWYQTV